MKNKLKDMLTISLFTYTSLLFVAVFLFGFLEIILPTGSFDELFSFIKMCSVVFILPSIGNGIWTVLRNSGGW